MDLAKLLQVGLPCPGRSTEWHCSRAVLWGHGGSVDQDTWNWPASVELRYLSTTHTHVSNSYHTLACLQVNFMLTLASKSWCKGAMPIPIPSSSLLVDEVRIKSSECFTLDDDNNDIQSQKFCTSHPFIINEQSTNTNWPGTRPRKQCLCSRHSRHTRLSAGPDQKLDKICRPR